jgi:serine O-acetyltransferase
MEELANRCKNQRREFNWKFKILWHALPMTKSSAIPFTPHIEPVWSRLRREAIDVQQREPALRAHVRAIVIEHTNFADALSYLLAEKLASTHVTASSLREIMTDIFKSDPAILAAAEADLVAIVTRDPAARALIVPFLLFKGFHALQSYRIAHGLWNNGRHFLALYIQSRAAESLAVDIHPAAKIGRGIMMDHAHGIVIGETAVIEDDVSLLHDVTLGGTGKEGGDRHPKIRTGVMIGAGVKILGNIEVGAGARIAAGSVVLEKVPPCVTVAGVPARIVGTAGCATPAEEMDQMLRGDDIVI